jgi:hypothetical protein
MAKELHFFDTHHLMSDFNDSTTSTNSGIDGIMGGNGPRFAAEARIEYEKRFPVVDSGGIVIDATPAYLHMFSMVPRRIKAVYTESWRSLRFIAVLRDPVERALSHWKFAMNKISKNHCNEHSNNTWDRRDLGAGCWGKSLVNMDEAGEPANFTTVVRSEIEAYKACLARCTPEDSKCHDKCAEGKAADGIIDRGLYGAAFRHWLRFFHPSQFCIISYNAFAGPGYAKLLKVVSRFALQPHTVPKARRRQAWGASWADTVEPDDELSRFEWDQPKKKNRSPEPKNPLVKQDMDTATSVLEEFYKAFSRARLFKLVEKHGYLGCGSTPLPGNEGVNSHSSYGFYS